MSTSRTSSTLRPAASVTTASLRHALVHRFATPLTTGLFAISALSGVALFFHWGSSVFHGMHEWLSMLLLLPVALHVLKNGRPLLAYDKRAQLRWPLVASLLLAMAFALASVGGTRGGNPAFRANSLLTQARLADLAPILHTTPAALMSDLNQRGYKAGSTDQTLAAIAKDSGKRADEALLALMAGR